MKKLLLSLTILAAVTMVSAQVPLYNGSFENWGAQQPNGWTTALVGNVLIDVFGAQVPMPVNALFGTQVSDAHAGSTALQLHPANVGVPGTQYNINFPGIAQLGVAGGFNIPLQTILDLVDMISGGDTTGFDPGDFDPSVLASLAQVFAPGDSCSRTPQSINMWVKFSPAGDDEMGVIAYSKSNGQPVGYAEITLDEPINEYTYLSVPFEEAGTPCDSLVVIIMAGTFGTADLGTAMWVDDVTISPYQVGVEESDAPQFHTYPNPATDYVRVAPDVFEPYTCQVLDLQGRLLRVVESNGEQCSVDVSDLASGIYMLKIDQKGRVANHKIVVR